MVSGIVAEISNAHNGAFERALRLIGAVEEAGADWIKFQCYTPDELVQLRGNGQAPEPWGSQGFTMYDLYTRAQTPHSWFPHLVAKCDDIGLPWFSSVFGLDSLALLEGLGCPVYKLASLDRERADFRASVIATGKPIIQSSPEPMNLRGVTQLYCPPGYPQYPEMPDYRALCGAMDVFDGFSYHGVDWTVPLYAVAWGAKIVEVHVQLDDEPSELERGVSLTISQLKELVEASR